MGERDAHAAIDTFVSHAQRLSVQWAGVQVGGGPTGVELAAEMHDYIKEDLSVHFPSLKVCTLALHSYSRLAARCISCVYTLGYLLTGFSEEQYIQCLTKKNLCRSSQSS